MFCIPKYKEFICILFLHLLHCFVFSILLYRDTSESFTISSIAFTDSANCESTGTNESNGETIR